MTYAAHAARPSDVRRVRSSASGTGPAGPASSESATCTTDVRPPAAEPNEAARTPAEAG